MGEKFMTLHPEGKQGVNIDKEKYDRMRESILQNLRALAPIGFTALCEAVQDELQGNFEGSITWYFTTVKLDLEARGELLRKKVKGKQLLVLPE